MLDPSSHVARGSWAAGEAGAAARDLLDMQDFFFALSALCHPEHMNPWGEISVLTALSRASSGAGGELPCLTGTLGAARHGERGVCSKAQTSEHH